MPEQSTSKNLFKSKTFWVNVATVAGIAVTESVGAQLPVGNDKILYGLGLANIFLRTLTNQPAHVSAPDNRQ